MAVPELGKIKIIPDFFNYELAIGNSITIGGSVSGGAVAQISSGSSIYNMLDHRATNTTSFDTNTGAGTITALSSGSATGRWLCYVKGENSNTNWELSIYNASAQNIENVYNSTISSSTLGSATSGTPDVFVVRTTSASTTAKGIAISDDFGGGVQFTSDAELGICHLGLEYEMPSNATASLSYNTKHFNKVNQSIGGQSYSTLYNTKSQRTIKASWEYVNWTTGSSGIDDWTTMMNTCFGSHVPVLIQLSQDGSIDDDYFMFARITSWNQTQMSPSLWKISAIFEEFI